MRFDSAVNIDREDSVSQCFSVHACNGLITVLSHVRVSMIRCHCQYTTSVCIGGPNGEARHVFTDEQRNT